MRMIQSSSEVSSRPHGQLVAVAIRLLMLKDYTERFGPDAWYESEKKAAWMDLRVILGQTIVTDSTNDK